jgi:hypothetical protein
MGSAKSFGTSRGPLFCGAKGSFFRTSWHDGTGCGSRAEWLSDILGVLLTPWVRVDEGDLRDFAERYTAAWCSQDAVRVAAFFEGDGSLCINGGVPAVGRAAIAATAQAFMTGFPDLRVMLDRVVAREAEAEYHWTLTGTNTGPGGTGRRVRISGVEQWRFGGDGWIAASVGTFDEGEWGRQVTAHA